MLPNALHVGLALTLDAGEGASSRQWIEWAVACSALDPSCALAVAMQIHHGGATSRALPTVITDPDNEKESP